MSQTKRYFLHPLAAAITFSCGISATAADIETTRALEEVTVTAQKREQSLQDVPVAVTALTGDELDNMGIQALDQVARQSPNVTLEASRATNSTLTAYIRGIGQQDPLWGFEPGVGVYIDDVYFARPQAALLDVFDVERIEVLRGPQGTLYGKNTIGGAIKYVTRSIAGDASSKINLAVGSHNQRDIKASGSIPLVEDKLWVGAAFASLSRDGYGEYVGPQFEGEENGNKDVFAYRLSMEAQPTDALNLVLNYDNTSDDSNLRGGYRMTPGFVDGAAPLNNVHDTRSGMDPTNQQVNSEGLALTVSYDVNESIQFKSITASREGDQQTAIDFDSEQLGLVEAPFFVTSDEQFSQEFQLIFTGEKLSGVAGLYYFDGDAFGAFDLDVYKSLYNDGTNPLIGTRTIGDVNTVSKALFANGTYQFNDAWSMTLGGRYSKDEKTTNGFFSSYNVLAGAGDFNNQITATDFKDSVTFSDFSPRASVEYFASEDVMLFASFSKGFKSGGFDPRANITALPQSAEPFDSEVVETVELGVKSELADGRLRLNATLFNNDYTDMHVKTSVGIDIDGDGNSDSFAGQVINAGSASGLGGELEAIALLTDNLSANLTVGIINAEFDEVMLLNRATEQVENAADLMVVSYTPESTVNFGLTYDTSAFGGELMLNANASYRGEVHMYEIETLLDQEGYTLFDINAVWVSPAQNWTLGLHGKNLTDEEYRTSGYPFTGIDDGTTPAQPNLANSLIGYYGAPRTVTASLSYQF
ncbi:TonB-dependent receptor [Microbulbifer hydrolyticus]|uniref:Iron complex outermembrane receptor protein n=1 Tax=Microbulbifer hydrolyticus TaxID=48074 RepID=A0AA89PIB7_9GAMM|nr:TonB-dependent receptor [Microbulbifer hydrolyticus]MBB5210544.1 iron complex outermembrane receptor protein [Microbulbifer hydrolyticus]